MPNVYGFPGGQRRTSAGYKSGRNSWRGTPVANSIGKTNSARTPFRERLSQYQTCDCEVPIKSASGFCPPAISQARSKASVDMNATYLDLGKKQQQNLSGTNYLNFGKMPVMRKVNKKAFGERVAYRRVKLTWSQDDLAQAVGMSQQGIDNIEHGKSARPRGIQEIAEALETTPKWLQWEEGPEELPTIDPLLQINLILQGLSKEALMPVLRHLKKITQKGTKAA